METIQILDFRLVYVWVLLNNLIEKPQDSDSKGKLISVINCTTLLEKQCYENAAYLWLHTLNDFFIKKVKLALVSGLPINEETVESLKMMRIVLGRHFYNQVGEIDHRDMHLMWVTKVLPGINELKTKELPDETACILEIISQIAEYLKEVLIEKSSEERLNWGEYSLYLLLKGYVQFFNDTEITDNNFPKLKLFFDFYSTFSQKTVIPVFVTAKEDNIVIEPIPFPDEIHLKLFNAIDVKIDSIDRAFILNYLGDTFVDNDLLLPLYAHEIGHLFDTSYMYLETAITNRLMLEHYDFFIALDKQCLQWIKEVIADSFAVCLMGPAYLCALINFINTEEALHASVSHPSIAYRIRIMYTYLYQNEFMNLFTPQSYAELQDKMAELQSRYTTDDEKFSDFEQILQTYISNIYQTVIDFLHNAGMYSSYDQISELICTSGGNLDQTKETLLDMNISLKNILNLQNINWLIELKNHTSSNI